MEGDASWDSSWGDEGLDSAPDPAWAEEINAAIEEAAIMPDEMMIPHAVEGDDSLESDAGILGEPSGGPELPTDAAEILLDALPVSIPVRDESGNVELEPDPASLQTWDPAERATAEHVISWLNECGNVPDAIQEAIVAGTERLDELMHKYDDVLEAAHYDRSDPDVRACAEEIEALHNAIEHAKDVLSDTRD